MTDANELEQLRTLARFPREFPNPLIRVAEDGKIDFVNDASAPLLEAMGSQLGKPLSESHREAFDTARRTRTPQQIELEVEDRLFLLDITPVRDESYLYAFGRDVSSERDAKTKTRAMAKFTLENPNPIMRVGPNGIIEFANESTHRLLKRLDARYELRVPKVWRPAFQEALDSQTSGELEVDVKDRVFRFVITPITDADYVYVFGQDVTERKCAEEALIAAKDAAESAYPAKFTSDGVITIEAVRSAQPDGEEPFLFKVRDTGIGIAEERISGIFEPFTQADFSTSRKFGGAGLGLALTRRFCEMMNGEIDVDSEPDVGTTFQVSLPARVRSETTEVLDGVVAAIGNSTKGSDAIKILAIDDDYDVLDLMCRMLRDHGFEVHTATSGQQGLELARELRPAAITLDVMMPKMDGWAVLAALKADSELCEIPVIMLTVMEERGAAVALGASDYLLKPIKRKQLLAVLNRRTAETTAPVLIVDDKPDQRELLRRILDHEGVEVMEAANGAEALAKVDARRPSLVLLNLMMPEMDGFQVVETLRSSPENSDIPVVAITGKSLTDEERERLKGWMVNTIEKRSIPEEQLLDRVRELIREQT